jgi:HSP20 family protein
MRLSTLANGRTDLDELWQRFFGEAPGARPMWHEGGYEVPTDVFHADGSLVIRMDLPEVKSEDVEVAIQENVLLINGSRKFPYDADSVRFVRRGTFYGDFTQRVALGKGLDTEKVTARWIDGVLELRIPYAEEVKPRKIDIEFGASAQKELS